MLEKIKKLCEDKGTTLSALERELGIGNGAIARWNKNSPSVMTVARVAEYFGVSIDYLVRGER